MSSFIYNFPIIEKETIAIDVFNIDDEGNFTERNEEFETALATSLQQAADDFGKKKSPIIFDITKRNFDGVISYNFHSSDPRTKVEDDFVTFEAYLIQQQMYLVDKYAKEGIEVYFKYNV